MARRKLMYQREFERHIRNVDLDKILEGLKYRNLKLKDHLRLKLIGDMAHHYIYSDKNDPNNEKRTEILSICINGCIESGMFDFFKELLKDERVDFSEISPFFLYQNFSFPEFKELIEHPDIDLNNALHPFCVVITGCSKYELLDTAYGNYELLDFLLNYPNIDKQEIKNHILHMHIDFEYIGDGFLNYLLDKIYDVTDYDFLRAAVSVNDFDKVKLYCAQEDRCNVRRTSDLLMSCLDNPEMFNFLFDRMKQENEKVLIDHLCIKKNELLVKAIKGGHEYAVQLLKSYKKIVATSIKWKQRLHTQKEKRDMFNKYPEFLV